LFLLKKKWEEVQGKDKKIDGDNEEHIKLIMGWAQAHAQKFNLDHTAINYRLTQGVVKRIIPAIASTNACVSAACANEAFKIVTRIYHSLDNFTNFAGNEGCYSSPTSNELNPSCLVCGSSELEVKFPGERTLEDFVNFIKKDKDVFQFYHSPVLTWEDDEDKEYEYIYTKNTKQMDVSLLKKPMNEIFQHGESMYLNQSQKRINEKGQEVIDAIKENKLKLCFVPLSEWLHGHQEFVDEWGTDIDKLAFKKS